MTFVIIILAAIAIFGLIAGIGHYKTYGRWSNKKYIEKHPEAYERQKQEWAKTSRAIDAQTQRIIEQKKAAQEYAKNHKPMAALDMPGRFRYYAPKTGKPSCGSPAQ